MTNTSNLLLDIWANHSQPDTPELIEIYLERVLAVDIATCAIYVENPTLDTITRSRCRKRTVTIVRHIFVTTLNWTLKKTKHKESVSFSYLGDKYGKNHSTFINSARMVSDLAQTDKAFRKKMEAIWAPLGADLDAFIVWANHYTYRKS